MTQHATKHIAIETIKDMGLDIYKVQASISTNASKQQCMIYNEDRSIMWTGNMNKALSALMNGELKIFVIGRIINRKINIMGRYPWQEW